MKELFGACSAVIGSVTQAMRAQSVLGAAAIPTTVIKYDNSRLSKGCVYGLSFSCSQKRNIESIFERERIRVKQWNTES